MPLRHYITPLYYAFDDDAIDSLLADYAITLIRHYAIIDMLILTLIRH
jgi:hypothetical protein